MRPAALLAALSAVLVAAGLAGSPGTRMRDAAGGYVGHLSAGRAGEAHAMLTESLGAVAGLPALASGGAPEAGAPGVIGRPDARGWPIAFGSSRVVWLREEGGAWRISGDTWLDGVLGAASVTCRDYALSAVLPGVAAGADPSGWQCPVSGAPYSLDPGTGLLVCPSGHLGGGLDAAGSGCSDRRAEAASVVAQWMSAGNTLPSSFQEIWDGSGGALGRPGGYRCPDDGYAYYVIGPDGIRCPFHGETTPLPEGD